MAPDHLLTYRSHGYRVEVLHRIGRCQLTCARHAFAEDVYIATWGSYKVTATSAAKALHHLRDWVRVERLYGQFWPWDDSRRNNHSSQEEGG
ncbi:hypothetical protein GCM10011383_42510 [Hymenobacter cavernae]|uniref:Uncharacterized protein n=1 Tax=Hymenobacter cavernae TaxID=2044852 RepID=A0ABQ1UT75_9BACT|nr:hypothetical protein GCM10011383_42510 [Hymenobacter cavernae]